MGATITSMNTKTNPSSLPTCTWNEINEPGCYLVVDWGCIARVPGDCFEGGSPKITFFAGTNPTCCKLSDDTYLSVSKARQLAADNDYSVNF